MNLNLRDLLELDQAGGELKAAYDAAAVAERKFCEICARIGATPDLGGTQTPATPKRRGGRPRKNATDGQGPPRTDTDGKSPARNRYSPDERICCTGCGTIIRGVRYQAGVAYPYRHDDPESPGHKCSGTDLPGKRTTSDDNPE
jgi:hypothetical protein